MHEEHGQWRFTKEQEARFTAKTCLIAAQGEQQDRAQYEINFADNTDELDTDTDDGFMIVDSSLPSLKRRFLDRLAEIFAREKSASFVSATAMEEYEDKVVIYLVRNEAIVKKDKRFCQSLKLCLESMSAQVHSADSSSSVLWEKILAFYRGRMLTHLSDLCDYINKIDKSTGKHYILSEGFNDDDLRKLVCLCRNYREGSSAASELRFIVELSYSIARSYNKSPTLLKYSAGDIDRQKFLRLMRFVGRAKTCYHTFVEAASRFPSFKQIDLILETPMATESRVPVNMRIAFPQDIIDSCKASKRMKPKKIAEITARYDDMCAKRLHVHAEIGLLFRLLRKGSTLSRVFPYIGISKKSCFLCHQMLLGVGLFRNRGCHGVLETQWTLPRSFKLSSDHSERLFLSFMKLQDHITEESKTPRKTRLDREPQSEAVVSDCISMDDRLELAARMEAIARIREDQAEAIFWEKQDSKKSASRKPSPEVFKPDSATCPRIQCSQCRREQSSFGHLRACTGCFEARYCNEACQKAHWFCHKFKCKGYRFKRADILVFDCWQDELPEDDAVVEDFGFMQFFEARDRQSLYVLYKDMVTSAGVTAHSLDQWFSKGCLREGIIYCYTRQKITKLFQWQIGGSLKRNIHRSYYSTSKTWDPEFGDCFLWFLKNHDTFSSKTPNWTWENTLGSWEAKYRPLLLDTEDQNVPISQLQPRSKRTAFQFWMENQLTIPQFPGESTWVMFGFCTCQTKRETARMISLYKALTQSCSFKEFWDAVRYQKMIPLFDKYDLRSERESFRHFQSVMDNSRALPSVWYLKSFVYDSKAANLPSSLRAVIIDYGFNHCRDATDRTRLRQAYREVFDQGIDELLLHEGCRLGQIFEFCSPLFPTWTSADQEIFRELMANPYPLTPMVPWAGLVAENVRICKESCREYFSQLMLAEESEDVLFVIDDDQEDGLQRMMAEANSYRLEEDLRRFEGQNNSPVQLSPEERRKAYLVLSADPVTGHEREILMLAPQRQSEDG